MIYLSEKLMSKSEKIVIHNSSNNLNRKPNNFDFYRKHTLLSSAHGIFTEITRVLDRKVYAPQFYYLEAALTALSIPSPAWLCQELKRSITAPPWPHISLPRTQHISPGAQDPQTGQTQRERGHNSAFSTLQPGLEQSGPAAWDLSVRRSRVQGDREEGNRKKREVTRETSATQI